MNSRQEQIAARLAEVQGKIPEDRTLIVVTKTFPVADIEILYQLGIRDFAENRDDEGTKKSALLPTESRWHYQGEIQSQKIRSIVTWAEVIHSLDDISHARKIAAIAAELGKRQQVFLQINLDSDSKTLSDGMPNKRGGIHMPQIDQFLTTIEELPALELLGVMGIAPVNGDPARAFAQLQAYSEQVSHRITTAVAISAGMSGDYEIALRFGATHLRIGSSILGSR